MDVRQPCVVVIAAGMSTMERERGELIDSFDVVVRVNGFSTDAEFAACVGRKSDVWIVQSGAARAHMSADRLREQGIKKVVTVCVRDDFVVPHIAKVPGCAHDRYPVERHLAAKSLLGFHPSTGMLALDWAVNLAGYAVVYYIGIDCFRQGGAHYWNAQKFSPKRERFIAAESWWLESFRLRGAAYPLDEFDREQHQARVLERAARIAELTGHVEPITSSCGG